MYMELTELDTYKMLEQLLVSAIAKFEFPWVDLNDYEVNLYWIYGWIWGEESDGNEVPAAIYNGGYFNCELSKEEINILAIYMIVEWLGQQLASVENTRMKYSGSDFKFTSQANHMQKLLTIKQDYEREGFHLQRLYKRRRKADKNGVMRFYFRFYHGRRRSIMLLNNNVEIKNSAIDANLQKIINQTYKLLPNREENIDLANPSFNYYWRVIWDG